MNRHLQLADCLAAISHRPIPMLGSPPCLERGASCQLEPLLQCAFQVSGLTLQDLGLLLRYETAHSRGQRLTGETAQEAWEAARPEDAVAKDGSTLRIHTQSQSEQERTGAGSHTANVGAGSTPLAECSQPGCTLRKEGTSGPAVAGIHRS